MRRTVRFSRSILDTFPIFFFIFARQIYEKLGYLQKNKTEICLGKEFVCIFVVQKAHSITWDEVKTYLIKMIEW